MNDLELDNIITACLKEQEEETRKNIHENIKENNDIYIFNQDPPPPSTSMNIYSPVNSNSSVSTLLSPFNTFHLYSNNSNFFNGAITPSVFNNSIMSINSSPTLKESLYNSITPLPTTPINMQQPSPFSKDGFTMSALPSLTGLDSIATADTPNSTTSSSSIPPQLVGLENTTNYPQNIEAPFPTLTSPSATFSISPYDISNIRKKPRLDFICNNITTPNLTPTAVDTSSIFKDEIETIPFPQELTQKFLLMLSNKDIYNYGYTCKNNYSFIKSNNFWETAVRMRFKRSSKWLRSESWEELYHHIQGPMNNPYKIPKLFYGCSFVFNNVYSEDISKIITLLGGTIVKSDSLLMENKTNQLFILVSDKSFQGYTNLYILILYFIVLQMKIKEQQYI